MLKFSAVAKFTVAAGTALALGLGPTANTAFGIVHNLKSYKSSLDSKTDPAKLLVLRNWGLDNDEQPSHINIRKAWKITKGSHLIKVAVVDTGIDANHPDLKDNICRKPGTDEYGYDFVLNKKNPEDRHGHGTHVAGIIGATAKAGAGAAGVAPNICIMAVRYYSDTASGAQNLSNTVKAINYAVDNGANIINYSGGGAEFSAAERKAIQRAESKGILFVAAAGNEYQNTDEAGNAYYPAAYGLSNIISVAATNIRNQLIPSSNWGKKHVHVAAPGENIYSTLPKGRYGYLTGTSQATAFVSGLAALVMSENPKLKNKPAEVRDIIMKSVDKLPSLESKVASGGRIDAYSALRLTLALRDGDSSAKLAKLDAEEAAPKLEAKAQGKTPQRQVAFH
jgi:subtilisin family serine protease